MQLQRRAPPCLRGVAPPALGRRCRKPPWLRRAAATPRGPGAQALLSVTEESN
jgi:hypothetical protein